MKNSGHQWITVPCNAASAMHTIRYHRLKLPHLDGTNGVSLGCHILVNMDSPPIRRRDGKKPLTFQQFLYNKETKECMGRTAVQWAKLTLFYLIFYIVLFGSFIALIVLVMNVVLSDKVPRLVQDTQAILTFPGMGFIPMPDDLTEMAPIISFKVSKRKTYENFVETLRTTMAKKARSRSMNIASCDEEQQVVTPQVNCTINEHMFDTCNGVVDNWFGFPAGEPCILLHLNKIHAWTPESYLARPQQRAGDPDLTDWRRDKILITCESGSRNKTVDWRVLFYPQHGLSMHCFPFCTTKEYLMPFVMAKFENLERNKQHKIWCRAWAKNIDHDKMDRAGSTLFTLEVND